MKLSKIFSVYFIMLVSTNTAFAEEDAKVLYDQLCASCHAGSSESRIAPPIYGVINHVKSEYPEKEDFVNYIVEWVEEPKEEKSVMPGAIRKFGLMPKLHYDSEKVRMIAEYLYDGDLELPEWYIEHYKEEHGHEPDGKVHKHNH